MHSPGPKSGAEGRYPLGYIETLKAAGATVLADRYFGSYQGDWWAAVSFKGTKFWVHGTFGSCSLCDAFQSEFYSREAEEWSAREEWEREVVFGMGYLNDPWTQKMAEEYAERNIEWDSEAEGMLRFIKENSVEVKA